MFSRDDGPELGWEDGEVCGKRTSRCKRPELLAFSPFREVGRIFLCFSKKEEDVGERCKVQKKAGEGPSHPPILPFHQKTRRNERIQYGIISTLSSRSPPNFYIFYHC